MPVSRGGGGGHRPKGEGARGVHEVVGIIMHEEVLMIRGEGRGGKRSCLLVCFLGISFSSIFCLLATSSLYVYLITASFAFVCLYFSCLPFASFRVSSSVYFPFSGNLS